MTVIGVHPACFFGDRGDVVNVGRFEQDVREIHDRGSLIDGLDQALGIDGNPVFRRDYGDLCPEASLLIDQVEDGRKMHGVGDDLRSSTGEIERAENDRVGQRHVGLEDDLALRAHRSRGRPGRPVSAAMVHQPSSQARTPRVAHESK